MTASDESGEKFLHPETLKNNLIAISLLITVFEIFKDSVLSKSRKHSLLTALMTEVSLLMKGMKLKFSLSRRENCMHPYYG